MSKILKGYRQSYLSHRPLTNSFIFNLRLLSSVQLNDETQFVAPLHQQPALRRCRFLETIEPALKPKDSLNIPKRALRANLWRAMASEDWETVKTLRQSAEKAPSGLSTSDWLTLVQSHALGGRWADIPQLLDEIRKTSSFENRVFISESVGICARFGQWKIAFSVLNNKPAEQLEILTMGQFRIFVHANFENALNAALEMAKIEIIQLLLSVRPGCIEILDLMHMAVSFGRLDVIEWLSSHEEVQLVKNEEGSDSVMIAAISTANMEMVELLQKLGWPSSSAVFNTAVAIGNLEILGFLAKNGCNKKDSNISMLAAKFGNVSVLSWLKENHFDLAEEVDTAYLMMHLAAQQGNLSALQWLNSTFESTFNDKLIENSSLEALQQKIDEGFFSDNWNRVMQTWMEKHNYTAATYSNMLSNLNNFAQVSRVSDSEEVCSDPQPESLLEEAVKSGDLKSLKELIDDLSAGDPDHSLCAMAAKYDQVHILQWLIDRGFMWDSSIVEYAASKGHKEVLKRLHGLGCKLTSQIAASAAKSGQSDVLDLLYSLNCPIDSSVYAAAAEKGQIDMLQKLFQWRCEVDDTITIAAAKDGRLDAVKWLCERDFPMNHGTAITAASGSSHDHFKTLQYLKKSSCPWDGYRVLLSAASGGNLEILKWLDDSRHGTLWDQAKTAMLDISARQGHLEAAKWLREEKNTPWPDLLYTPTVPSLSGVDYENLPEDDVFEFIEEEEEALLKEPLCWPLEALKWADSAGCSIGIWPDKVISHLLTSDLKNAEIVRWLVDTGKIVPSKSMLDRLDR